MSYPGGKNGSGVYQKIICQMPPHRVYVEPFLGGGAIMRLKRPAPCSIGIDADAAVIELFRMQPGSTTPNLTLVSGCGIEWLANTPVSDDTLVYLDPPYVMSSRSSQRQLYRYEISDDDHLRLLTIINRLTCMVMISGYYSEMYASALRQWRTIQFQTRTRGGRLATEWLWMNFAEPLELHDYQYLGDNFRERERIKRKRNRWRSRLETMDALERHAIMSAIADLRTAADNGAFDDGRRRVSSYPAI